jgi:hypothetical protein
MGVLGNDIPGLVRGAAEWQKGERTAEAFGGDLELYLRDFLEVRDKMTSLEPYKKAPHAHTLYVHSMQLYVEVARMYTALVGIPAGDLQGQLDLTARRVRELGDRVYDRGKAAMDPYLHEPPMQDVEVRLPEEVPMWVAEGLAAGPPLSDPPPPAAELPPNRQDKRPQQSRAGWEQAVKQTDIPAADELATAIDNSGPEDLRALSDRFVAAAEALRDKPDPPRGREKSAILRLSLLVDGEAARVAQAARLIEAPDLAERFRQVARRLAVIGEELWPSDVSVRRSNLDRGLLTQPGP